LPPDSDRDGDQRPDAPLPTLLYVHGGPHIANPWESWFTNRNLQLLADRGYAVLNVDYRGAEGYGKEFVRKGWLEWGGEIQKDFLDVADWVVANRIAEPGKVGIWGWSFGGLSTNAALAFAPEKFACGISMYGLSDMEAFVRYVSLGRAREGVKQRIGDVTTDEGLARLQAQSPLRFAERVVRPLLITHGAKDLVAPKGHSDRFVAALREHGKNVTYLVYPDEPHDYRTPEAWISFWAVAERFLHEHLGGRYEPYGDDLPFDKQEVVEGRDLVPGLAEQLKAG
jgi:dipeptidyl aminopeptidase/acylaminoacyl peptidase